MRRATLLAVLVGGLTLGLLPAAAQNRTARPVNSVRPPTPSRLGTSGQVFVPGFGLRPVIQERFPVFGLGFDAHHFHVLGKQRGFFHGFAGGFFPGFFPFAGSSTTVVVVPQVLPIQIPVPVIVRDSLGADDLVVAPAAGLPPNWNEVVKFVRPSLPPERPALRQLTLLVLKDSTIFAVTDYWLEEGRIFYLTSTGRQDSVAVRDLDWETTAQLNAERRVEFVLRSR